jgi:Domain of unknown function (DUF4145)
LELASGEANLLEERLFFLALFGNIRRHMDPFNWTCPFCNQPTTITATNCKKDQTWIELPINGGRKAGQYVYIACPNPDCRQLTMIVSLNQLTINQYSTYSVGEIIERWQLIPSSRARVFPDYIPTALRDDYREACEIRDLSPKASATLSRRCLQGMIRDFWNIKKSRLKDEIDDLQGKVDVNTWDAIDAVRQIGNIGAHMEKDVNVIVDVEPEEAQLLIELIETLFEDWYIDRHDKQERNAALKALADAKSAAKKAPPKTP